MKILSHPLALAAVVIAWGASPLAMAAARPTAPCARLAARARSLPAPRWRQGVEKAMAPTLFIDKEHNPDAPNAAGPALERSLTQLPWIRTAVDNEVGNWSEFVSRLPGHDIYMVSTYQGTLHCQGAAFVKAPAGAEPTQIPAPTAFGEGGICWTKSGRLGRVDGQPAFIQGGADSDHTFDASYAVIPWRRGRWAPGCRVNLRFRSDFEVVARHCDDAGVCRAAGGLMPKVARAYDGFRRSFDRNGGPAFEFGPKKTSLAARRRLIEARAFAGDVPDFPRFGDKDETYYGGSFSYVGFQLFPLRLRGRWYVAAIGHEGVGWRESDRTLVAIYVEKDDVLTPIASFEVKALNAGLIAAKTKPGA